MYANEHPQTRVSCPRRSRPAAVAHHRKSAIARSRIVGSPGFRGPPAYYDICWPRLWQTRASWLNGSRQGISNHFLHACAVAWIALTEPLAWMLPSYNSVGGLCGRNRVRKTRRPACSSLVASLKKSPSVTPTCKKNARCEIRHSSVIWNRLWRRRAPQDGFEIWRCRWRMQCKCNADARSWPHTCWIPDRAKLAAGAGGYTIRACLLHRAAAAKCRRFGSGNSASIRREDWSCTGMNHNPCLTTLSVSVPIPCSR